MKGDNEQGQYAVKCRDCNTVEWVTGKRKRARVYAETQHAGHNVYIWNASAAAR